jgi:hypothetical protein
MEEKGFIVLHRQILNWEWYDHLPTKVLFIHCLLRANHSEGKWRGQAFKRGQFITSLNSLATETGLTIKQVRIALENLEKTKELGKQTTSQNTLLTVLNYDLYQSKGTPKDKGGAKEGQSKGKGGATDNNDNNDNNENNENNINTYPSFDEFFAYAKEHKPKVCYESLKLKYHSWSENDWCKESNGKRVKIKNWKSTLLNTLQYIKEVEIYEPPTRIKM